ncbi:MAG: 50S ribosomal protein L10 [Dehalococcoidales bacterium]|nr:50S ribosomal protein L10 [Dehalococcoidales bacterium]
MSIETKEKKAQIIEELQETFSECSICILTDYRGLTATEMNVLRRKLRESNIEYKVVKNTLARFAAARINRSDLLEYFEGPTAIAIGQDEINVPAKILSNYIRDSKAALSIKGGFLDNRLLSSADVANLSTLPSKEILIAKALGGLQSPIVSLVNCLTSPIRGAIGILQARINQLEEE